MTVAAVANDPIGGGGGASTTLSNVTADPTARRNIGAAVDRRIRFACEQFGFSNTAGGEFSAADSTEVSSFDRVQLTLNGLYRSLGCIMANIPTTMFTGNRVGNPIVFNASMVVNSQLIPFDFDATPIAHVSTAATKGRSGYVIGDGQMMVSKLSPLGGLASGGTINVRKYHAVGLGERFAPTATGSFIPFTAQQTGSTGKTTSAVHGTGANANQSDQNIVGGTETVVNYTDTSCRYWGPIGYIGEQITEKVVVYVVGHSVPTNNSGNGWVRQALNAASIPMFNVCLDGYKLTNMCQDDYIRQAMAEYCDYVFAAGVITNDMATSTITTLTQAKTLTKQFVRAYSRPHNRIVLCTETPHTTSTDAWATYANQTKHATNTLRIDYNNWIRDTTATGAVTVCNTDVGYNAVSGFYDNTVGLEYDSTGVTLASIISADGQQTSGQGGLWKISNTSDGDHPNATGRATMVTPATTAATTLFVLPLAA